MGGYQTSYRSNDRVTIISQSLSTLLFKRISGYFPDSITHLGATWEPVGLNEVFRFCRYGPGGIFGAHRDTYFARSKNERSFMTINIYLNDTDAGCTRFLDPKSKEIIFQCQPQTGKALVFLHNEYHDGDVLQSGSKYLMRTDLMYRLKSQNNGQTDCSNDKRTQAKQLYAQAEEFEEKGQYDRAVQCYKKAIIMWPTIEREMDD
jgi:prolyl 4-hydroxylase